MNELEWPKLDLITSRRFKKGQSIIADYTPRCNGKSWTEKVLLTSLAARCSGKTNTVWLMWEDECNNLFPHKQRKLLQSKSKQSRLISVVCK